MTSVGVAEGARDEMNQEKQDCSRYCELNDGGRCAGWVVVVEWLGKCGRKEAEGLSAGNCCDYYYRRTSFGD